MTFTASGEQNPPWQRPIMARVRHLSASSDSTGTGPCRAATSSASVTSQQRHTTCPQRGSAAMARARSSSDRSEKGRTCVRRGSNVVRSPASNRSATSRATCTATAGADVRPGESKQATLKNPGASGASPITKSPSEPLARRPAKFVIRPRLPTPAHVLRAASMTKRRPSSVVDTSVLENCSTALGPTSRLPCTVGATSTPLPTDDGAWNMVRENVDPHSVSYRQYSPLRGVMRSLRSLTRLLISSANTPAAFTTARATKRSPASVVTT